MVEQRKRTKTSSTAKERLARGANRYEIKTSVSYVALLPKNTELHVASESANESPRTILRYAVAGTLGEARADARSWNELPHEAFANLRLDDPKAVAAFIAARGVIRGLVVDGTTPDLSTDNVTESQLFPSGREAEWSDKDSPGRFLENSERLFEYQDLIRSAWVGSRAAAAEVAKIATDDLEIHPLVNASGVKLVARKLGSLIGILFLRDYGAGKCGVCSNPDCAAHYFLKRRKTQKFCEAGPCVVYAQRRYALKWWHKEHGKSSRSKQK